MVGLLGQLACREERGGCFQFYKLKVIFSNISSILINYPERLSKLLFEYFMAFMLTFQGQSAILCFSTMHLLSEYIFEIYVVCWKVKRGEFFELLAHTKVKCDLFHNKTYLSIFVLKLEINNEIDLLYFHRTC